MSTVVKQVRSSDGTLIYAEAVGHPHNPHVVFIHEATFCLRSWNQLFLDARFTDHLYLMRYDLRCHGRSGIAKGLEGQHPNLYADDYAAVASAFDIQNPIIVTWGFGAAVVADICGHANPVSISGVVCVAPSPYLGQMMRLTVTPYMLDLVQKLTMSYDAGSAGRAKTEWVDGILAGPSRPTAIAGELKATLLGACIAQDPEFTRYAFTRPHDPTRLLEAGRRGLPLMLVMGAQDALVDGDRVVCELRRHFRNLEAHVVAQSSHAVFVDQKDEFVKLLLVFVGHLAVMTLMNQT